MKIWFIQRIPALRLAGSLSLNLEGNEDWIFCFDAQKGVNMCCVQWTGMHPLSDIFCGYSSLSKQSISCWRQRFCLNWAICETNCNTYTERRRNGDGVRPGGRKDKERVIKRERGREREREREIWGWQRHREMFIGAKTKSYQNQTERLTILALRIICNDATVSKDVDTFMSKASSSVQRLS